MRKQLTVTHLLANGFQEIGSWNISNTRLSPTQQLPWERGVYAFAENNTVLYVGLASRSIRQRLGFYAYPGASQKTNIRLNGLIRSLIDDGSTVRILIAHPRDTIWNSFRISGAEGLEAALIEDFDLPWNIKGSIGEPISTNVHPSQRTNRRARSSASLAIVEFVEKHPKCTERQIAKGVFGPDALQPRANPYCRRLVEQGTLTRLPTRPATYVIGPGNREESIAIKAYDLIGANKSSLLDNEGVR